MKHRGFTLVEISIVLIIIGLVLGGVLAGKEMIKAAEFRSVVKDVEQFNSAVNTFRIKYKCLPGDCTNATEFFGTDAGGCAVGSVASGTCNGDGSGTIGCFGQSTSGCPTAFDGSERFLAWQQLALAGMIAGKFSGTSDSRDTAGWNRASVVGWNVPASKVSGGGYVIINTHLLPPDYDTTSINDRWQSLGHWIFFGNPLTDPYASATDLYETSGPVLSGTDARSLDQKLDDGNPNLGNVLSIYTDMALPDCVDVSSGDPAYMSGTSIACSLQFKAGF